MSENRTYSSLKFIGRRRELEMLENAHQSPRSSLIPVYGRRRVGKSELILHFMKEKPGVYFLGKKAPAGLQIREFLKEAAATLQEPLLANLEASRWKDALTAVVGTQRAGRKLILAFDEVQWTAATSPELLSDLQGLWDRQWQASANIFLVLCGSFVGFMEKEILGRRSPLFGRRTAQLILKPFGFREAAGFHPYIFGQPVARAIAEPIPEHRATLGGLCFPSDPEALHPWRVPEGRRRVAWGANPRRIDAPRSGAPAERCHPDSSGGCDDPATAPPLRGSTCFTGHSWGWHPRLHAFAPFRGLGGKSRGRASAGACQRVGRICTFTPAIRCLTKPEPTSSAGAFPFTSSFLRTRNRSP